MELPKDSRILLYVLGALVLVIMVGIARRPAPVQGGMNYPTAELAANAFISQYEWRHGVIEDTEQETFLIEEATHACTNLDVDHNIPHAWQQGVADGMSSDQAATVVDLAIRIYCPKHDGDAGSEAKP